MLSAPAKIAATWFKDSEKAKATTIAALGVPIGNMFGFVLPSLYIHNHEVFTPIEK